MVTYSIDPPTGALEQLSTAPLAESFPYIYIDKTGRWFVRRVKRDRRERASVDLAADPAGAKHDSSTQDRGERQYLKDPDSVRCGRGFHVI